LHGGNPCMFLFPCGDFHLKKNLTCCFSGVNTSIKK
jgi:hypothetical protein